MAQGGPSLRPLLEVHFLRRLSCYSRFIDCPPARESVMSSNDAPPNWTVVNWLCHVVAT